MERDMLWVQEAMKFQIQLQGLVYMILDDMRSTQSEIDDDFLNSGIFTKALENVTKEIHKVLLGKELEV